MKAFEYVAGLDLSVGQTYRGDCPTCRGHNTFTVTNDSGNLIFNCYKAGCTEHGVKHGTMDAFTIKTMLTHNHYHHDDNDTVSEDAFESPLSDRFTVPEYLSQMKPDTPVVQEFMTKFAIHPDDVLYDVRQDRIVFPVYTEDNVLVDAVGRSVTKRQPKWLRYASSPVPYTHGHGPIGVIVEDAISAYVIGEYFYQMTGIALLGTQLTEFHQWYIPKYFDRIIVALDPDARDKTLQITKEMRELCSSVTALNISDDLKYMREVDFNQLERLNVLQ